MRSNTEEERSKAGCHLLWVDTLDHACLHGRSLGDNHILVPYQPKQIMRIVNLLVVNMISVKLLLVIAKLHGLDSNDFMLAFPQAELDVDNGATPRFCSRRRPRKRQIIRAQTQQKLS